MSQSNQPETDQMQLDPELDPEVDQAEPEGTAGEDVPETPEEKAAAQAAQVLDDQVVSIIKTLKHLPAGTRFEGFMQLARLPLGPGGKSHPALAKERQKAKLSTSGKFNELATLGPCTISGVDKHPFNLLASKLATCKDSPGRTPQEVATEFMDPLRDLPADVFAQLMAACLAALEAILAELKLHQPVFMWKQFWASTPNDENGRDLDVTMGYTTLRRLLYARRDTGAMVTALQDFGNLCIRYVRTLDVSGNGTPTAAWTEATAALARDTENKRLERVAKDQKRRLERKADLAAGVAPTKKMRTQNSQPAAPLNLALVAIQEPVPAVVLGSGNLGHWMGLLGNAEARIDQVLAEAADQQEKYHEHCKALDARIAALVSQIADLNSQLSAVPANPNQMLIDHADQLKKRIGAQDSHIGSLEKANGYLRMQVDSQTNRLQTGVTCRELLEAQVADLQAQLADLKAQLAATGRPSQATISELEAQVADSDHSRKAALGQIDALVQQINEMQAAQQASNATAVLLQQAISRLEADNAQLHNRVEHLQFRNTELSNLIPAAPPAAQNGSFVPAAQIGSPVPATPDAGFFDILAGVYAASPHPASPQ